METLQARLQRLEANQVLLKYCATGATVFAAIQLWTRPPWGTNQIIAGCLLVLVAILWWRVKDPKEPLIGMAICGPLAVTDVAGKIVFMVVRNADGSYAQVVGEDDNIRICLADNESGGVISVFNSVQTPTFIAGSGEHGSAFLEMRDTPDDLAVNILAISVPDAGATRSIRVFSEGRAETVGVMASPSGSGVAVIQDRGEDDDVIAAALMTRPDGGGQLIIDNQYEIPAPEEYTHEEALRDHEEMLDRLVAEHQAKEGDRT